MNLGTGDYIAMSFYNAMTGNLDEWRGVVPEPLLWASATLRVKMGQKFGGRRRRTVRQSEY